MILSFWICLGLIVYTYIGYPILLFILVKLKNVFIKTKPIFFKPAELPKVSLVVACYNEGSILEDKIRNTLELNYPEGRMDVCFVTDGSNDESVSILAKYNQITNFHSNARLGKNAAINRILPLLKTPYIIFCDANTFLNEHAVINLMRHYKDDKVGAVAGEKRVFTSAGNENASAGEGAYWRYESQLKRWDSELCSVVGAAGELFSVRAELMAAVPEGIIIEDFYLSVKIAMDGFTVRYEPEAYAMETGSSSIAEERKRKVRIAAGGLQAVMLFAPLLNFFKYGIFSFQYISHRFFRWTIAPLCLLLVLMSNIYLVLIGSGLIYVILLVGQLLFYFLAALGNLYELRGKSSKLLLIPFYFTFMNVSVYQGLFRLLSGKQSAVWEKSVRAKS